MNYFNRAVLFHCTLRLLLTGVLGISLVFLALPEQALAYSCATPNTQPHCYGQVSWSTPPYFGTHTVISTQRLQSGDNGFVDDEIWLVDERTPACISAMFGACWVEAGILASYGGPTSYFWAQNSPTHPIAAIFMSPVPDSYFGLSSFIGIERVSAARQIQHLAIPTGYVLNDADFFVGIGVNVPAGTGCSGGLCEAGLAFTFIAMGNSMRADRITIGQELAGTSPPSSPSMAPQVTFAQNGWIDSMSTIHLQISTGILRQGNPPSARWLTPPSLSMPGGVFATSCCS